MYTFNSSVLTASRATGTDQARSLRTEQVSTGFSLNLKSYAEKKTSVLSCSVIKHRSSRNDALGSPSKAYSIENQRAEPVEAGKNRVVSKIRETFGSGQRQQMLLLPLAMERPNSRSATSQKCSSSQIDDHKKLQDSNVQTTRKRDCQEMLKNHDANQKPCVLRNFDFTFTSDGD